MKLRANRLHTIRRFIKLLMVMLKNAILSPARRYFDCRTGTMLVVALATGLSAEGALKTATWTLHNLSLNLGYSVDAEGYKNRYSTYDGRFDWAAYQTGFGYSGELSPAVPGSSSYRTDFDAWTPENRLLGYGFKTLSLPPTDSNQNGLPDFLEIDRSVDATFSGTASQRVLGIDLKDYPISGTIRRDAGKTTGTYTMTDAVDGRVVGNFASSVIRGAISYSPGGSEMIISGESVGGAGTLTGTIEYRVLDRNHLVIDAFILTQAGRRLTAGLPFQISRTGSKYNGIAELVDGSPETSWRDYIYFHLSVEDRNDSDADAIPDLTDPVDQPPTILSHPLSTSVVFGARLQLEGAASGTGPITYQWWHNEAMVAGANNYVLVVENVSLADAGRYVLAVRNAAGEVRSNEALVGVRPATGPVTLELARSGNVFELIVRGNPGTRYAIEKSTDMDNWSEVRQYEQTTASAVHELSLDLPSGAFVRVRTVAQ